jgi:hypothetical protein
MNNEELVNASELNEHDKLLLINMLRENLYPKNLFELSIFSKKGTFQKKGEYNICVFTNDTFYYSKYGEFWVDSEFKILPYSNNWQQGGLQGFFNNLSSVLFILKHLNPALCNLAPKNNYVSIQKWNGYLYGHFFDEVINLRDFMEQYSTNSVPFISYPLVTENINYDKSNFKEICEILFDNNYYNSYREDTIVNNVTLILNQYGYTFHSFPLKQTDYIINHINKNCLEKIHDTLEKSDTIFITRSIAKRVPRNLTNQTEIEEYFEQKNITIFNPENESFSKLVKIIQQHKKIIITWGSALVNLSFCKPFSEVIILKSKSYENETFFHFQKIISNRNLKIKIINHIDNKIYPELIVF